MVSYARLSELLWRTVLPAAVGGLIVAPGAAWLIDLNHRANAAQQNGSALNFTPALLMLVFALAVLPLGSWLVLWIARTPASPLVMLVGWICSLLFSLTFAGGDHPYWTYGLCALVGYGMAGLATALLVPPKARSGARPYGREAAG